MDKIGAAYLCAIQTRYPDLTVRTFVLHRGGQFSDVLFINHELVFRFPRYPAGAEAVQREARQLNRLRGCLPIPIPEPLYLSAPGEPAGRAFMGYRRLPGEPLDLQLFNSISDGAVVERLARQLAEFLHRLHHLPLDDLEAGQAPGETTDFWRAMYADIRANLFPMMRADARRQVAEHFEGYLSRPELNIYPTSLRHGDFGTINLLYDPLSRSISGVLDWSEAGTGDPATDIAAVSCFGQPFFERFCCYYPGVEALLERARFCKGTFALQEALHGFHSGDREAFESGMADYRN